MPEHKKDSAIVRFIGDQCWAILPERLDVIIDVVADHMAGKEISLKPRSEDKPKILGSAKYPDITVIDIEGTLAKKLYGLDAISGGETMRSMQSKIQSAIDDNSVKGIILRINSPGGTVDGTKEFADFIRESEKPIVAYADGLMASAAYWIGSAASKIVAFDTSIIGSIGVISKHREFSKMMETAGVKDTYVYSGKYKAFGNPSEPLSDEAKEEMQSRSDYFYSLFVNAVAENRGVSVEVVLKKMADAKLFIGQQAKEAGLVDAIGGLDVAFQLASELINGGNDVAKTLIEQLQETPKDEALKIVAEAYGIEISEVAKAATPEKLPEHIQAIVDEANNKALAAEEALAAKEKADSDKAKKNFIISSLSMYGLNQNESLLALGESLDEDKFSVVLDVIGDLNNKLTTLTNKLGTETKGATDKEAPEILTFDQAVKHIMDRDSMDLEAAQDKAAVEFKDLYNKTFGGNE